MEQLYRDLIDRLNSEIEKINPSVPESVEDVLENIDVCIGLRDELRLRYLETNHNEEEQIIFFKTIKPIFISELLYQRSAQHYVQHKPFGYPKLMKGFLEDQIERNSFVFREYPELYKYKQMNSERSDREYYTHSPYDPRIHDHLELPSDPAFSSPADTTLSILLATEKFQAFLNQEWATMKSGKLSTPCQFPKTLEWEGTKVDIVENIYGLASHQNLKSDVKVVAEWFGLMFGMDMTKIYRSFQTIKQRQDPVHFLEELKNALIKRIDDDFEENH